MQTETRAVSVHHLPRTVWGMAFTELWERFSFYGLQGILSFYLLYSLVDGGLELGPAAAAGIVGAYGGAVYLAQLLGAWLGERVMSPKWMVFWGGVIITLGHVALAALPGIPGLTAGLLLIVLGTGTLKTNITAIVGLVLAGRTEAQRDVGFAYFYMSINVGAVVGPLSTGFVQNEWGFHWGFGLAAVGMLAALVQYVFSMRRLPEEASLVPRPISGGRLLGIGGFALLVVVALGAVWAFELVRAEQLAGIVTAAVLIAAACYFVMMLTSRKVTADEKRRVGAYLPLFLAAGIYFGLLFQQFTTISILIAERVDLRIGEWSFPVAWITMISQLAAVVVTPLIAQIWGKSGTRGPGAPAKFGIGLIQIGLAYVLMLVVLQVFPGAAVPLLPIIVVMIVAGSSEVFVGPISLSLSTRIGPEAFKSQLVGLNFLTLALGSSFSGLLGQLFSITDDVTYFLLVIAIGVVLGGALWLARKPLQRGLFAGL
ncbi:peptide MFS transporter [Gulosibacter sp. 10]|uniref:peptide MFS transporter n=1 Tax=Gulosibacter sp. 10 TaxID=1255570 RepID=UPI00097EFFB1|nr:oligopeptide:H+ symporter [Gulosibacter sp. 10]SJM54943.1 Di-/tripeptide transporter [Gulosibacter sp. 10]